MKSPINFQYASDSWIHCYLLNETHQGLAEHDAIPAILKQAHVNGRQIGSLEKWAN